MNNKVLPKKTSKRAIIISITITALIIAVLTLYFFVVKVDQKNREAATQNRDNAATLRAEKDRAPVVIDGINSADSQNDNQSSTEDLASKHPTLDVSGLSTNLDRQEVRPAVTAVLATYQDFLAKLRAVPMSQRQAVADEYLANNQAMFSSTYGYLKNDTLHLFPQNASVNLPDSVSINSAIIDPDDSSQTIVQVFMQPDDTWSFFLYVKMNGDGKIGTFEKLVVRMNQNPL